MRIFAFTSTGVRCGQTPGLAGRHAYTASRLRTVLTAGALKAVPDAANRHISGIAYCPGQTPGTGLVRGVVLPLRVGW